MNVGHICPQCRQNFGDEEYCPRDGARLLPSPVADQPAVAAPQPSEEGSDKKRDSKLVRFMHKFGLRKTADKSTFTDDQPTPTAPVECLSPLPEAVREKGWRLAGLVQSSASVDCWPVESTTESSMVVGGRFHRFRSGALTTDALYRRLVNSATPRLAHVCAHGTVDLEGARADYELVSLPKAGRSLNEWFRDSTPSEQRAWHLYLMLVSLLRQLTPSGVRPLAIEPAWLQITGDGELWLATAGALTAVSAGNEFRPEFERSALLPYGWAAPELTQQNMNSVNAVVFSLGQLVAQAVWGQPRSIAELQTGAVPFQSLGDARLARVLMGCLWPHASERWTVEQIVKAAVCEQAGAMPATPPWDSLAPGASSTAFSLAGASFWRLEDLLATAVKPSHWDEASARIEAILDWSRNTAWAGHAELMREALSAGRSADWVLVALTRAVIPDTPPTWRTLDLSDNGAAQSLASLAQRALQGSKTDEVLMRMLVRADLRSAFTQVPTKR